MEVFFCRDGYLRTTAFEYMLDNCQDNSVHLTNNAVQKGTKEYGKFEDGNQLDFKQFQEIIDQTFNP
jgi:tubulin--tyrosine ligase